MICVSTYPKPKSRSGIQQVRVYAVEEIPHVPKEMDHILTTVMRR